MTVIKTVLACDRRDLLKYSALGLSGIAFANLDEMVAYGACDTATLPAEMEASTQLLYWIDGPFTDPLKPTGKLTTRAKFSAYVDMPQTASAYVEYVALVDAANKIVASTHFTADDKTSQGMVPYVVFDQLTLDSTQDYKLVYLVRKGQNSSVIYKYLIKSTNIRNSRFDYSHLGSEAINKIPAIFRSDINQAAHAFKDTTAPAFSGDGILTTPYQHFAAMPLHSVRFKIRILTADGTFKFEIEPMHADENIGHYMRYFLVMDPVGRILGALKRPANGAHPAFYEVTRGVQGDSTGFNTTEIAARNIWDCPYVQVLTEDKRDAMCRIALRLR